MTRTIIFIVTMLFCNMIIAQLSIGFAVGGIGFHPKVDSNHQFYKWKIDKKGKFAGYSSISFIASYRFNQNIGFKINHTQIIHDCAGKQAGFTHFGINLYDDIIGWKNKLHEFSLSFGPLWYYRKGWAQESGYINNPEFMTLSKDKTWERKFVWHGGTIEYNYSLSDNYSLAANILPGYPFLYTAIFGFNKTIR